MCTYNREREQSSERERASEGGDAGRGTHDAVPSDLLIFSGKDRHLPAGRSLQAPELRKRICSPTS